MEVQLDFARYDSAHTFDQAARFVLGLTLSDDGFQLRTGGHGKG